MIVYFDDVPHTQFGLALRKGKEMDFLPQIESHTMELAGKAGSHLFASSFKERIFKFPFSFVNYDRDFQLNDKLDELKEFFVDYHNEVRTVRLRFSYTDDRFYWVRLTGATPLNREFHSADVELEFIASDPYAYGRTPISVSLNNHTGVVHTFNQVATPLVSLTYKDTFGTTNFTFTLRTSFGKEHKIILDYPPGFRGGDKILIDYSKNIVTLNGVNVMRYLRWQESDFVTFPKGDSRFTYPQYWEGQLTYTPKWL